MSNHAPGPWRLEWSKQAPVLRVIGANGYPITGVSVHLTIGNDDEANAQLIAAAPDLLEACEETADFLRHLLVGLDRETQNIAADLADLDQVGAVLAPLEAAIARAKDTESVQKE